MQFVTLVVFANEPVTLLVNGVLDEGFTARHLPVFKVEPVVYTAELDKFAAFALDKNYRPYLKTSVAQNLATIAVIYCDWNNGVPHWEFAQKYLGEKQLELLQPVYGDAITKLQNNCDHSVTPP